MLNYNAFLNIVWSNLQASFLIIMGKKKCLKRVTPEKIWLSTKAGKFWDQTPAECIKKVKFLNSTSRDNIQIPSIGANSWKTYKAEP